jgi:maltose-binding protein MalE
MEYLASDSAQLLIHLSTLRQPVSEAVLKEVKDPVTRGFIEASKNSVAVPSPILMQHVWGPMGQAQIAILAPDSKPAEIWSSMLTEIKTNIGQ